jgi:hypothetical protein
LDLAIYQVVHRGDFVLNNQQAWRGSVGVSKHHGIISPAYVVLALGEAIDPRFADYLFQSRDMVAQVSARARRAVSKDGHLSVETVAGRHLTGDVVTEFATPNGEYVLLTGAGLLSVESSRRVA